MSAAVSCVPCPRKWGWRFSPPMGEAHRGQGMLLPSALWQGNASVGLLLARVFALFCRIWIMFGGLVFLAIRWILLLLNALSFCLPLP